MFYHLSPKLGVIYIILIESIQDHNHNDRNSSLWGPIYVGPCWTHPPHGSKVIVATPEDWVNEDKSMTATNLALALWSDVTDDRLMTGWYLGLAFSGTSRNVLGPGLNWHGLFWRLLRQCPADTNECFRGCSHFRASWCGAVRGWWDQGGGWGWLRPSKIFKDPGMLVKDHHSCFWVCFRHTRWKDKDGTDGACKCLVT